MLQEIKYMLFYDNIYSLEKKLTRIHPNVAKIQTAMK